MTDQVIETLISSAGHQDVIGGRRAHWGGVFAMTLCVFALIASEFMPISLLTPMAADLHVTEGLAGSGVAVSGAFAVLASLSLARLAGGMDRRTLLLSLTALIAVSGACVALAPNYAVYMLGRALIGVAFYCRERHTARSTA